MALGIEKVLSTPSISKPARPTTSSYLVLNMSYGDYGRGGGDRDEYGGGGRGGDNYYDQGNDFSDRPQRGGYNEGGYGGAEGRTGGGRYGQGMGGGGYDQDEAISHANQHSGSSGDSTLFSQALSFINGSGKDDDDDIDEQKMVNAHQAVYQSGGGGQAHSAQTLGAGAAMQALKMFSAGESGGGNSQSQFIGTAMAQASKLFDEQGGNVAGGGDKQSVVNEAGKMALKMYMKSQGGGSGGMMSLASKFL